MTEHTPEQQPAYSALASPRIPAPIRRALAFLAGPRFVDPPIRVILFGYALFGFSPASFESSEPGYVALNLASTLLLFVAPFFPLRVAVLGFGLGMLFLLVYPEFMNPFEEVGQATAAILISYFRWKACLITLGMSLVLLVFLYQAQPDLYGMWDLVIYTWTVPLVLGISAGFIESRIRSEILLREQLTREHEIRLRQDRTQFAIDAHDTVAHGLATQQAITKVLSVESMSGSARRLLGELSMSIDLTQTQLRTLLAALTGRAKATPEHVDVRGSIEGALGTLLRAAESSGFQIHTRVEDIPHCIPDVLDGELNLILREIVTNMIKHASTQSDCSIQVGIETADSGDYLCIEAQNPSDAEPPLKPESIVSRATRLGGGCSVSLHEGHYRLTVLLPCEDKGVDHDPSEISPVQGMR